MSEGTELLVSSALETVPYPMPDRSTFPPSPASWQPDPLRSILLIHDMQNFFLRGFGGQPPVGDLVANIAALRSACVNAGVPIAYSCQPGSMSDEDRGLLNAFWGRGMTSDENDRGVTSALRPSADDWMVTKWRYSAFHRSDLLERIQAAGRDQLIVCGVYAHIGVLMTACEAFSWDLETFLVGDAVADFSPQHHQLALNYASTRCAQLIDFRTIVELF